MLKSKSLVSAALLALFLNTACSSSNAQPVTGERPDATVAPAPDSPETTIAPGPGQGALDSEEAAFLRLINDYRAQYGLAPLGLSPTLTQASQWLSDDMAGNDYLSHTDSLGRSPSERISDFGYKASMTWGENVAAGNSTAQKTFQQWKSSPGHNQNMLSPKFRAIGIGRSTDGSSSYGWYWATAFAGQVD